jgi:hypothetical protein
VQTPVAQAATVEREKNLFVLIRHVVNGIQRVNTKMHACEAAEAATTKTAEDSRRRKIDHMV